VEWLKAKALSSSPSTAKKKKKKKEREKDASFVCFVVLQVMGTEQRVLWFLIPPSTPFI
jgi:hypothetical protein